MEMSVVDRKINTADYKRELDKTLSAIINQLKDAESESSVASRFENNLYFLIKSFFNQEITFDKEVGAGYYRHHFSFKGRMDAVSNELVIEYKHSKKLSSLKDQESALNQVKEYLTQLYAYDKVARQAILTDGSKICYFYFNDDEIINTAFHPLDINDLDRIVKSLLNVGLKQFDPRNIVRDFRVDSPTGLTNNLAHSLFNAISLSKTTKTNMLFKEWQVLFRLSETDKGKNQDIIKRRKALSEIFNINITENEQEYLSLYVLQTTFAIIVKLIACKVLTKIRYSEELRYFSDLSKVDDSTLQVFTEQLEDGYIFNTGGIRNLLEGDFFSWYSDNKQWDLEIGKAIKDIIIELENYASATFTFEFSTIDIFKDLYMQIMPNEVRHSLGEYFTPSWLSDQVVSEAILMNGNKKDWRAIDPCCGSGVFLITLIKKILAEYDLPNLGSSEKKEVLQKILHRVHGIDLNPLSVLTARISYLLAIRPLIEEQQFEIPIYLGDSANIPRQEMVDSIPCYTYTVDTQQGNFDITLPESFVKSQSFFENMYLLQTTIKAEDSTLLLTQFLNFIGKNNVNGELTSRLKVLSEKLVDLHSKNWDGIWIRIATNFMLIARITDIDIIVGNPPWIKWEFLPQNYAEKIKALCVDKNLFSGQTYMGAISLNLCALIANVTASQWLKKDGVLAFIMPKTIMTQDSYEGFRKFHIKEDQRLYLQQADDWSKSGNPFVVTTEKFMTYFYRHKYVDYSKGVPTNFFTKDKKAKINDINLSHLFSSVENKFNKTKGLSYQLTESRSGFTTIPTDDLELAKKMKSIIGKCEYKARSGVEFTPAEVYFISPSHKSNKKGKWFFTTNKFKSSVYKSSYIGAFELETEYVRPVIKSPKIKPFNILPSDDYCIFPYKDGSKNSVNINDLVGTNDLLLKYFIDNKHLIGKQSQRSLTIAMGDDFYSLSKVGLYTYAPHKVTFRDNTNMCASVVSELETPWGDKLMPICAKHCPYISLDNEGNEISNDEAHYLCAILNTNIVNKYFKLTYSERSYSINFNIKMPKFDITNKRHKKLADLAKQAANIEQAEGLEILVEKMDEIYLDICGYQKSP